VTAQVHERLILDGKWTSIAGEPPLPHGHPRVVAASEAHRKEASPIVGSTACWRGYIATWEIREKRLYLVAIEGGWELQGAEPLLASWVSGELRVPMGEMVDYIHLGHATLFAEELFIAIEKGHEVSRRSVVNRKP
jgi:hypothetical protein